LTALEEEMQSPRGALINRVFRKKNLMSSGVHYGPSDFTCEEAQVLELIAIERPSVEIPDGA
jgi:hypothetical protein